MVLELVNGGELINIIVHKMSLYKIKFNDITKLRVSSLTNKQKNLKSFFFSFILFTNIEMFYFSSVLTNVVPEFESYIGATGET